MLLRKWDHIVPTDFFQLIYLEDYLILYYKQIYFIHVNSCIRFHCLVCVSQMSTWMGG